MLTNVNVFFSFSLFIDVQKLWNFMGIITVFQEKRKIKYFIVSSIKTVMIADSTNTKTMMI